MNDLMIIKLIIAALPGIFIHFFPLTENSFALRKHIIGGLALISITLLYITRDHTYLHYMLVILPLSYVAFYVNWGWLVTIFSLSSVCDFLLSNKDVQIVESLTYILIISFILYYSKNRYHILEGSKKITYLFFLILSCITVVRLLFFQFSNNSLHTLNYKMIAEDLFFMMIFIVAVLLSYSFIVKQDQTNYYKYKYEQLRNTNEELQSWVQVIKHAPFSVMIVNNLERLLYANQQAIHNYIGLPDSTELSKQNMHLHQIMVEPNYTKINEMIARVYKDIAPSHSLIHEHMNDLLYSAIPILYTDKSEIQAIALFIQDVTELEQYRRELNHMDRLNIVGEMAASITHEIRNPMSVVRGYVQLLRERSTDSDRRLFDIVLDELDRTNTIISDFLMLAQNKREQKYCDSINAVIRELIPLLQADTNLRGQTLQVELIDDMPPFPIVESELKQLILNISRNGVEAMTSSGVLTIKTEIEEGSIVIIIEDEGEGIPDEIKGQIFDPFFTSKESGTGLGLPLCNNIAKKYNGWIKVQNNLIKGTAFKVYFPFIHNQMSG